MARIALCIQYDGSVFCGWQRQTTQPSVAACVEQALQAVACHPIELQCAGRTDTGVHAIGQVVHFDTEAERPLKAWCQGVNSHLPSSIRVNYAVEVSEDFHARFSATARTYHYLIYDGPVASAIMPRAVTCHGYALDAELMQNGANYLLGEQDFSALRSAECQSNTPMRHVHKVEVSRLQPHLLCVAVTANAFLHHMVRNIIGVLFEVGRGGREPAWVAEVLASQDRSAAGVTAPANGLYLLKVDYPEEFGLPIVNPALVWWQ